jgi:methionine synthase II (cobalamin-independent)
MQGETEREMKVVLELLRHSNLKVTTDTYMQALSSDKRQAQAKLITMVRGKERRLDAKWTKLDHEAKPSKGL